MSELSQLSPQPLWDIFAKICSIPHPSYHEEQLAEHIMGWAKEKGLHAERDQVGNILIRKPATAGMENRKPVVLQAHLDMVPQKNNDTVHDFTKDPIQPYIDGDWVKARGTTLGADNGIGMASALAVLADDSVEHGPLEVLLTMTEEAGMDGAFGLQANWLQADILINTDSEEEGEIYMGCAGGIDFISTLPLSREAVPAGYQTFKLTLKGLKGGHSGGDIHLGLGNANKLLARFLAGHAAELDLRLVDFNGGTLRNAIPREAFATVAVPAAKADELKKLSSVYLDILKNELSAKEKNLTVVLESVTTDKAALTVQSRDTFVQLLNATPNGVIRNSDVAKVVVETSLNVGVVTMSDDSAEIICLIRSLIDSGKEYVVSMLESLGTLAGAKTSAKGSYPGWQPDASSPVMALV
ncbi:TPA: beta-Ala-His dipeptidase, partial [Enterobacter kobei]